MHFDELLLIIGGFGRYQQVRLFLICCVGIVCAFHAMNMVFVGAKPDYKCKIEEMNLTESEFQNTTFHGLATFLRSAGEGCSIYSRSRTYELISDGNLTIEGSKIRGDVSRLPTETCTEWVYSEEVYGPTIVSDVSMT